MFDRMDLWNSLVNRTPITLDTTTVVINTIQAEDGSGWSFNVSGQRVGYSTHVKMYVNVKRQSAKIVF